MSLLDEAKRLASTDPEVADICFACGESSHRHYDDCPWLVMPRIVAALEAAQAVVNDYKPQYRWADVMLRLDDALEGKGK